MTQYEKVKAVAKLLMKKFPSLTTSDAVNIAALILELLDKADTKVSNETT